VEEYSPPPAGDRVTMTLEFAETDKRVNATEPSPAMGNTMFWVLRDNNGLSPSIRN